jgi:4a-hydroxytetrahydrobiopterin dehydratase
MAAVLTETELTEALTSLPGWSRGENSIIADYSFRDFNDALVFVNSVAQAAEQMNHHPDIDIRYNKVRMLLTSHDSGGVTRRDTRMAKMISEIAAQSAQADL